MKRARSPIAGVVVVMLLGLWSPLARGDGVVVVINNTYGALVMANTVIVCVDSVSNTGGYGWPYPRPTFLRYDLTTGGFVALGDGNFWLSSC